MIKIECEDLSNFQIDIYKPKVPMACRRMQSAYQ